MKRVLFYIKRHSSKFCHFTIVVVPVWGQVVKHKSGNPCSRGRIWSVNVWRSLLLFPLRAAHVIFHWCSNICRGCMATSCWKLPRSDPEAEPQHCCNVYRSSMAALFLVLYSTFTTIGLWNYLEWSSDNYELQLFEYSWKFVAAEILHVAVLPVPFLTSLQIIDLGNSMSSYTVNNK